jgi:hypothetical protein
MNEEIPRAEAQMTPEQLAKVAQLSQSEIRAIDETLLSNARHEWRKVAMVVGLTMTRCNDAVSLPDIFYSQRVRKLVEDGRLESQGNLVYMRFSEVRLPTTSQRTQEPSSKY